MVAAWVFHSEPNTSVPCPQPCPLPIAPTNDRDRESEAISVSANRAYWHSRKCLHFRGTRAVHGWELDKLSGYRVSGVWDPNPPWSDLERKRLDWASQARAGG